MASLIWAFWLGEATARAATPPEPPRSVLLSTLHPISRTGYGGQAQLLVAELQRQSWHVQLLAWNLRHRGEPPAEDLETLLLRHKIGRSDALEQAGGDPRVLLSGVPVLTSRIAPPTGHETGEGWLEVLRAVDLLEAAEKNCSSACSFRKPDVILHLHDAWWLGPAPLRVKDAGVSGHLPPLLAWLPILFDPLLSDDKERPDRSGQALEVFGGVIAMSVWGRGVYEGALASPTPLRLPPLLGHVPHALEPSFSEGPLAFESEARQRLRRAFGLPEKAFVVLLVGRNPPSGEANRKSHKAGIRAFTKIRSRISELCNELQGSAVQEACARTPTAHLHVHCDLDGSVDIRALLAEVGLGLTIDGGASNSRERLSPEQLRSLYTASDVLLQLSRAEGFGLPVIEAQACGVPVIVNGATAMAENVVLGKVLLPKPRQTPSGGRDDRPGSWTPPDSVAAAEALLAFWVSPPSPTERNAARMILHSTFSQASVGQRVSQLLQTALRPRRTSATSARSDAGPAEPAVPPADSDRAAFCVKEFRRAEECWRTVHSECSGLEEDLRICFRSDWKEPRLAKDKPAMLRNRLTSTRQGWPMLYNVYDIMVGRMLEVCGSWLGQEALLHSILLSPAGPGGPGSGRVLEAGAHIGAMTVPMAQEVLQGRLLALEPSRLNLQLLTANLALAQVSNVDTHQAALGAVSKGSVMVEEPGIMPFADLRFFGPGKKNRKVPVVSVDQLLGAVDRLDLLRLGLASTAGHGLSMAIAGAVRSLERFQPWVLAELPLRDSGSKLDLKMEVSGDDEASFLNSMDSSAYDCVRCDLPVGMTEEPPESWASCASDPRAQLKAKMLLCGHRSRTSGASSGAFGEFPDASVWLRAVAACESFLAPEARKQRQTSQLMEQQCRESKDVQQRLGATLQQRSSSAYVASAYPNYPAMRARPGYVGVQETHMSLARMRTEAGPSELGRF
ncbi:mshA [Symbiodinium necroappetens]|uniref:MshA protein n=1 Tax=Symbiodinium necroappetens TaxID=1628268 RepID=A0A812SMZ7_9DINO|nr:mshA [Symbiodinium necroappetens]